MQPSRNILIHLNRSIKDAWERMVKRRTNKISTQKRETPAWGGDLLAPRSDDFALQQALRADGYMMYVLPETHATRENIRLALERIDEIEEPDTEVLISFSGHGGQTSDVSPINEADNLDEFIGVYDTNNASRLTNAPLDDDLKT